MTLDLTTVKRNVRAVRRWARQYDLTWRYGLNFWPTVSYRMRGSSPSPEMARVLRDLNRNGIAITTAEALLGPGSSYDFMRAAVDDLKQDLAEELADARRSDSRTVQKPYMYWLLGERAEVELDSVYARFALEPAIADIANAYYGMFTNLCVYNIWYNFALGDRKPSQSQLWHRDPEDRYILKVFACLSDVDDTAGPFTYAPGTHLKGPVRRMPAYLYKDGPTPRSDDAQMAAVVPCESWVKGVGAAGTIIFADTRGYHKGGLCLSRDRVLYVAEFLSPSAGHAGIPARVQRSFAPRSVIHSH